MSIYTFFANSYIECITDISSRSTNHFLRRHSILLASICNSTNNNKENIMYAFIAVYSIIYTENNEYLLGTLFASISVSFKPLIRPVISTIHICSQIVATHKLGVNGPIMCSLSKPDLRIN